MNLLLDTHTFLWFATDDPHLSFAASQLIQDPLNERWLSVASPRGMAIKQSTGKLKLTTPLKQFLAKHLPVNIIRLQPITVDHLATVATLALHHRDPFDRLIISQAMVENMTVISADGDFDRYPITRRW